MRPLSSVMGTARSRAAARARSPGTPVTVALRLLRLTVHHHRPGGMPKRPAARELTTTRLCCMDAGSKLIKVNPASVFISRPRAGRVLIAVQARALEAGAAVLRSVLHDGKGRESAMHTHSLRHSQNVPNIDSLLSRQAHNLKKLGEELEIHMMAHPHNPQHVLLNPSELHCALEQRLVLVKIQDCD